MLLLYNPFHITQIEEVNLKVSGKVELITRCIERYGEYFFIKSSKGESD